jgi:hypothetical protein
VALVGKRGKYESLETRESLLKRPEPGTWTQMEIDVFNALCLDWDRTRLKPPSFSERLRVADAMLAAFDAEAEK